MIYRLANCSQGSRRASMIEALLFRLREYTNPQHWRKEMSHLKKGASLLSAGIVLYAITAAAQSPTDICKPAHVIPLTIEQPPAKIVLDPPLAEPLASRGVVIIQYCAQNLYIAPVFGPHAVTVSPRVGHVHVSIDDASWVWADASGNPIILQGLLPGPHKVLIEL